MPDITIRVVDDSQPRVEQPHQQQSRVEQPPHPVPAPIPKPPTQEKPLVVQAQRKEQQRQEPVQVPEHKAPRPEKPPVPAQAPKPVPARETPPRTVPPKLEPVPKPTTVEKPGPVRRETPPQPTPQQPPKPSQPQREVPRTVPPKLEPVPRIVLKEKPSPSRRETPPSQPQQPPTTPQPPREVPRTVPPKLEPARRSESQPQPSRPSRERPEPPRTVPPGLPPTTKPVAVPPKRGASTPDIVNAKIVPSRRGKPPVALKKPPAPPATPLQRAMGIGSNLIRSPIGAFTKALGPAGIAVGAFVVALQKADAAIRADVDKFARYSGVVAQARARSQVRRVKSEIRQARRIGPRLAKMEDARSRVETKISESLTELKLAIFEAVEPFLPMVTAAADQLGFSARALGFASKFSLAGVMAQGGISGWMDSIKKDVKGLLEYARGKDDSESDEFFRRVFDEILPFEAGYATRNAGSTGGLGDIP